MDYIGRLNHSRRKNRALPSLRRLGVFVAGLLVLSIAAAPALAQTKKVERVAVLTFKSIGAPKEMGEAVAEILRTELVDVGGFELVERGQIEALLKEQKLQLQDVIDEKTAVKIGRLSGAKLVVIGSIVKLGTTFTLNSHFIDVQTGITRIGKNIRGNSENEISNMCRQLAYVIAGRTYVEKRTPQPRTPRKPVVRAPKPTPRKPQPTLRPYATFKTARIERNVTVGGRQGIRLHGKFTINNFLGRKARFAAFFRFKGQSAWINARQSASSQYKTSSGYVTIQEAFTPKYESTRFSDFKIFMPNIEFNRRKGKHNLEAVVQIHDENGKNLKERSVRFTYTR